MKQVIFLIATVSLTLSVLIGCRDVFTTSLFSTFERDGLNLSSNTPMNDLLAIAQDPEGGKSDPVIATELLDALAGKPTTELTTLPIEDKEIILNLAVTAGLDLPKIADSLTALMNSDNRTASFTNFLASIDPKINTAAIMVLLNDPVTLANADALTLTMASLVIVMDLAASVASLELQTLINAPAGTGYGSVVNPVIQQQIETIRGVLIALDNRPQAEKDAISFAGVNIFNLLTGA